MSNSHKETRRRPRVTSTSTSPDSLEAVGFLYLSVSVHQLISFVPRPHYRFLKCTVASALVTGSHTSLPGTLLPFRPTGISREGERKERGDWITGCQGRVTASPPLSAFKQKESNQRFFLCRRHLSPARRRRAPVQADHRLAFEKAHP